MLMLSSCNVSESLVHLLHLKLIHDLADAFATGSNNAGMNSVIQGDVFRDHLFQLVHNSLNGVTRCYGFVLIPSNGNLILREDCKFNMEFHYFIGIFIQMNKKNHPVCRLRTSGAYTIAVSFHTWLSSFFSGNWILTSCSVRMLVMMAPFRPMILGWYLGSTVIVNL